MQKSAQRYLTRRILAVLSFCFSVAPLPAWAQTDSVFSPVRFFEAVSKYHPFVKQAGLFITAADQELLLSRGFFDPKLLANFNRKSFDGKDYYNLFNPELKIPTWPGIDLKAGFERNAGTFVNDEETTPITGLQYLGVSLPLGQGLFTDSRRTAVKQAKVGLEMAEAERLKQVYKVLFSAAKDYWDWYFNKQQLINAEFGYRLANERYRAVRQRIYVGDLAPVDSVEAHILVQDREIFLNQSRVEELNSRLQLSTYLWSEEGNPLDLGQSALPEIPSAFLVPFSDSSVQNLTHLALRNHPEIRKIELKSDLLQLDRKLGMEMLKPQANLHYSWLSRTDQSVWATQTIDRNYKFGFDFAFPLLLRKERGKLGLIRTKLLQNNLDQIQTRRNIGFEIQSNFNELQNLQIQIRMQADMVENYRKLRNAEVRKFENGESSLFLINSRESKLIEALIKQASLVSKYQKQRAAVFYAAGRNPLLPLP